MASIPCTIHLHIPSLSSPSMERTPSLSSSPFLAFTRRLSWLRPTKLGSKVGPTSGGSGSGCSGARCWFKFGSSGVDAEVEGTYDKMEALLNQNIHPVDILLMLAASEGDKPKIEELLRAGANYDVKDADGRTALDRASSEEIKEFIVEFSVQKA
ncbi:uncharacterized protein A4U43_C03F15220 [Asparagus officinalis]|uniref:Protein LHCP TRANSLOCATION DEFECT n=1 Tax=Asparagus officinalis TaxID=4686 RepID=A0A5P1FFE7_ASPOF|nr:uncharacterized protein A4U43_C03F15220 [Asparagus officinalis]